MKQAARGARALATPRRPLRRRIVSVLVALVVAYCSVPGVSALHADTIFLKDGNQILDCKITSETDASVSVTTPSGKMVVPRSAIYRIVKSRTVHDTYAERLAKIREGDTNNLFKLAQWCRGADGLRKEADELLEKVIELQPKHTGARRLLGHIKVHGEWVAPEPLVLHLKFESASGVSPSDLRSKLALFLQTRSDVRVATGEDLEAAKESGDDAGKDDGEGTDGLDTCTLGVSVIASQKAAGTFYGLKIGRPSYAASVSLRAKSDWAGKTPPKTSVSGMVPVTGGSLALAVQNALGSNSRLLHKFLDDLVTLRSKTLEKERNAAKKGA